MPDQQFPTQIRLTAEDRARLAAIQKQYGLPTLSAAIRFGIELAYRTVAVPSAAAIAEAVEKSRKKPKKKSE